MKIIKNSKVLRNLYYSEGSTLVDGTGRTFESPLKWYNHVDPNDNTKVINLPSQSYIELVLQTGKTYSFYQYSYGYDGELFLLDKDGNELTMDYDMGGGTGDWPGGAFEYAITQTGSYVLGVGLYGGSFDYAPYKDDITVKTVDTNTPPIDTRSAPGFVRRSKEAVATGWDKKNGKLKKYRSLESADILFQAYPFLDGIKFGMVYMDSIDEDLSGNVSSITKVGAPTLVENYVDLDANSYYDIPNLFSGNEPRTIMTTLKIGTDGAFIGAGNASGNNKDFTIYSSGANIAINGWYNDHTICTGVAKDQIVNLCITFDGSSLKCYKNTVSSYNASTTFDTAVDKFYIGASPNGNKGKSSSKFYSLYVYNRAITETEIQKIFEYENKNFFIL